MKKQKILIVILIQLNLVVLLLNLYAKDSNIYICYDFDEYGKYSAAARLTLDDDKYVSEYIRYFSKYNKNNFKETLSYSTKFYKQEKEVINNRIYISNTNGIDDKTTIYSLLENYPNYTCIMRK